MGTEGQDRATALARETRARKEALRERAANALIDLLNAVRAPRGGNVYFDDRCVACVDKNRHLDGHRCPCACHPAREVADALH